MAAGGQKHAPDRRERHPQRHHRHPCARRAGRSASRDQPVRPQPRKHVEKCVVGGRIGGEAQPPALAHVGDDLDRSAEIGIGVAARRSCRSGRATAPPIGGTEKAARSCGTRWHRPPALCPCSSRWHRPHQRSPARDKTIMTPQDWAAGLADPRRSAGLPRLDAMLDLLTEPATLIQVILLSCRERAFRHVDATRLRHASGLPSRILENQCQIQSTSEHLPTI